MMNTRRGQTEPGRAIAAVWVSRSIPGSRPDVMPAIGRDLPRSLTRRDLTFSTTLQSSSTCYISHTTAIPYKSTNAYEIASCIRSIPSFHISSEHHVSPTKPHLTSLQPPPPNTPPALPTSPGPRGTRTRRSMRLPHPYRSPKTRLHTAQDSARIRLWRPHACGRGTRTTYANDRRRKRRGGYMPRCRRPCGPRGYARTRN